MEKNPIRVMYNEHDVIVLAERSIQHLFHTWLEKPELYVQEVKKLLKFFSEYADKLHHGKEEAILFPALRKNVDFTLGELLEELEAHHERFREYVHKIRSDLERGDYPESWAILKEYCNDLLDHIAIENDELFVLAESLLGHDEQERMYYQFADVDKEFGIQKKNELESYLLAPEFIDSPAES